ncbi:hypothetical protein AB4379_03430 [Vibrio breoganii]|uniref:hypothetical protein n=1 Tax=Vibrio breoganii TaxID=553239 RepID=UPI0010564C0D|nr:hypothetical protein [Vibrio breoganii]MDN3715062.1 hypothetical protein [Vibrio breoganii]
MTNSLLEWIPRNCDESTDYYSDGRFIKRNEREISENTLVLAEKDAELHVFLVGLFSVFGFYLGFYATYFTYLGVNTST